MHKKSELENMSQEELMDIAKELGIQTPGEGDRMGLIYQIIDEESIQSASQKAAPAKTPKTAFCERQTQDRPLFRGALPYDARNTPCPALRGNTAPERSAYATKDFPANFRRTGGSGAGRPWAWPRAPSGYGSEIRTE